MLCFCKILYIYKCEQETIRHNTTPVIKSAWEVHCGNVWDYLHYTELPLATLTHASPTSSFLPHPLSTQMPYHSTPSLLVDKIGSKLIASGGERGKKGGMRAGMGTRGN